MSAVRRASAPADQLLEKIEALVDDVRAQPGRFADAAACAAHVGLDEERLTKLLRQHYHATPEDVLRRARLADARRRLLSGAESPARIAAAIGYASLARFAEDFQRFNGLGATAYRALAKGQRFTLRLPPSYPLGYLRRALGRDHNSATERLEGDVYTTAIRVGEEAHLLTMTLAPDRISVSLGRETRRLADVHAMVVGLLGLDQDTAAFGRHAQALGLQRLIAGRPELRISQTHTIYSGLLWTIVGQQINFTFASLLLRRLIEKTGLPLDHHLHAPPTPQAVAALNPEELLSLQYSRQKADYVTSISRLIAEGALDLESLPRMSATRAEQTLLAVRGLGPWSVNYLMMRALGFADCLPLGDTGVTSGLVSLFQLKQRPDAAKTIRLLAPFSPFRSLATAHLWQLNQPIPE